MNKEYYDIIIKHLEETWFEFELLCRREDVDSEEILAALQKSQSEKE